LLSLPAAGITLAEKQAVNEMLLRCGATIAEINCVRKHLSAIKGGQLALAAYPARVITLIISDVPDDDPATVASGPSVADPTTYAEALAVIAKYRLKPPAAVLAHLQAGAAGGPGAPAETPKPGDRRLSRGEVIMLATAADALAAAAAAARASDVNVQVIGTAIEGEARVVGREQAELALRLASAARSTAPASAAPVSGVGAGSRSEGFGAPSRLAGAAALPLVVLSGGETTVTVRGHGRGGPNTEYLLSLALTLAGKEGIYALAADSDGTDGSEDNAGAFVAPDTLARAAERGLDPAALLADNDAYTFFAGLDDLFISGPTQTNVNDVRALLILPSDG
jgi:hydroxypyruvate reductase